MHGRRRKKRVRGAGEKLAASWRQMEVYARRGGEEAISANRLIERLRRHTHACTCTCTCVWCVCVCVSVCICVSVCGVRLRACRFEPVSVCDRMCVCVYAACIIIIVIIYFIYSRQSVCRVTCPCLCVFSVRRVDIVSSSGVFFFFPLIVFVLSFPI